MALEAERSSVLEQRSALWEFVVAAIGISIATNLIVSGFAQTDATFPNPSFAIGLGLAIVCLVFFVGRALSRVNRRLYVSGVFPVLEKDKRRAVAIARYRFSEELEDYFKAICAENAAIAKTWETLEDGENKRMSLAAFDRKSVPPPTMLVREAVEYFVLDCLSVHLSSFFQNRGWREDALIELGRDAIPSVLLKNRFLEMFSKPMEDRAPFIDHGPRDEEGNVRKTVVWATGKDGAIFDRFELILPKGTKVGRKSDASIHIEHFLFKMEVRVRFDGFGGAVVRDFEQNYMGAKFLEHHMYDAAIEIVAKFSVFSMLTRSGIQYFRWIESFLAKIENEVSFERFLTKIGWETASTVAIIADNRGRVGPETPTPS